VAGTRLGDLVNELVLRRVPNGWLTVSVLAEAGPAVGDVGRTTKGGTGVTEKSIVERRLRDGVESARSSENGAGLGVAATAAGGPLLPQRWMDAATDEPDEEVGLKGVDDEEEVELPVSLV